MRRGGVTGVGTRGVLVGCRWVGLVCLRAVLLSVLAPALVGVCVSASNIWSVDVV